MKYRWRNSELWWHVWSVKGAGCERSRPPGRRSFASSAGFNLRRLKMTQMWYELPHNEPRCSRWYVTSSSYPIVLSSDTTTNVFTASTFIDFRDITEMICHSLHIRHWLVCLRFVWMYVVSRPPQKTIKREIKKNTGDANARITTEIKCFS